MSRHTKDELFAAQDAGKTVQLLTSDGEWTNPPPGVSWSFSFALERYKIVEDEPEKHIHHDLIVAWAKGAVIQYQSPEENWITLPGVGISWSPSSTYRIKPAPPPPDIVQYGNLTYKMTVPSHVFFTPVQGADSNIRAVFDPLTHNLKSIEVLQ